MLRTDLRLLGVTGAVFKIAGEMCQLPVYFDNPAFQEQSWMVFMYLQVWLTSSLKELGHAILGNFSIDQMAIQWTEITK